ncbi:MAG TPA: hypothetical protein VGE51_14320 [Fontimonas sp.]
MKPVAFPALLIAACLTGALGACDKPGEREEPDGLPRETVPMTVPPLPGDPRPPPESTIPPQSPQSPRTPGDAPPLPMGGDRERLPSSGDTAQRHLQDGHLV